MVQRIAGLSLVLLLLVVGSPAYPQDSPSAQTAEEKAETERIIAEALKQAYDRVLDLSGALGYSNGYYKVSDEYLKEEVFRGDLATDLRKATDDYKATVASALLFRTKDLTSHKAVADALTRSLLEAERDVINLRRGLAGVYKAQLDALEDRFRDDPAALARVQARVRGQHVARLKLAYHKLTAIQTKFSSHAGLVTVSERPDLTIHPPNAISSPRTINWITYYIAQLVDRLVEVGSEYPDEGFDEDIVAYLYDQERDFLIREVMALVHHAPLLNVQTGVPFTDFQRRQVTNYLRRNIADYVRVRPLRMPMRDDELVKIAERLDIQATSASSIMSQFVQGADNPSPRQFFLAAKIAMSEINNQAVEDFRTQYLQSDEGFWTTGLGSVLRANDMGATLDGPEGITIVRNRLQEFELELENISRIFDQAYSTENPADLSEGARNTLKDFGMVVEYQDDETGETKYQYHTVNATQGIGDFLDKKKVDLNIPGATVWNVITPKNIAITAASSYIPGLGARWITTGLEAAGYSSGAVMLGKFLMESTISAGMAGAQEAVESYMADETFTVNYEKILLESYGLGAIQEVAGFANNHILEHLVRNISEDASYAATRAFFKQALQEDPSVARKLYEFVNANTGILLDASVGYAFQPMIDGQPMDAAAFQSMLMQNALARIIDSTVTSASELSSNLRQKGASDVIVNMAEQNPELAAEIIANQKKRIEKDNEAKRAFEAYTTEEGFSAGTYFHKMLTGEFDWNTTKKLLTDRDISIERMDQIAVYRYAMIEDVVAKGRERSTEVVKRNLDRFYAYELSKTNDPAVARRRTIERVQWEMDLISQNPEIPGSGGRVSDVDRSSASVFLRRAMVEVAEINGRLATGELVVTTGQAIDSNEYFDSLPIIKESAQYQAEMRGKDGSDIGLARIDHENAMHAISMSMALKGASAEQADIYFAAKQRELVVDVQAGRKSADEMALFNKKLDWAKKSITDARQQLKDLAMGHAEKSGVDMTTAYARAQEDLYNQRLLEINNDVWDLHLANSDPNIGPDHPDSLIIRARLLRRLAIANRDGINTYSSPVTIDLIINGIQFPVKERLPDGTEIEVDYTFDDRMEDETYTIESKLKGLYTEKDIDGARAGQDMYLMKYINYYRAGKANEVAVARAIGKYMERAFFFDGINGKLMKDILSLPETDPKRRLFLASKELVKNKGDLVKLGGILAEMSRGQTKSQQAGLAELFYLMEQAFPRFRGSTGVVTSRPVAAPLQLSVIDAESILLGGAALIFEALVAEKRKKEAMRSVAGEEFVLDLINDQLAMNERETNYVTARLDELRELAEQYSLKDWEAIRRQGREWDFYRGIQGALIWPQGILMPRPGQQVTQSAAREVRDGVTKSRDAYRDAQRRTLAGDIDEILSESPKASTYRQLKNRLDQLKSDQQRLQKERTEALRLVERQKPYIGLDVSGRWSCRAMGEYVGVLEVAHNKSDPKQPLSGELYKAFLDPEPFVKFDANYRFGRVSGVWYAPGKSSSPPSTGLPAMVPARPLEMTVNARNQRLRFSGTPVHASIPVDWSSLTCKRDSMGLENPDDVWVNVRAQPLDNRLKDEQPDETFGLFSVRVDTPEGEELISSGELYRNGRPVRGPWFRAGRYMMVAWLSKKRVRMPVTIHASQNNVVRLKAGALKIRETAPGGTLRSRYSVFDVDDLNTPVKSGDYREDGTVILAPGTYTLVLERNGLLTKEYIEVDARDMVPVEVEWSELVLEARNGSDLKIRSIQSAGLGQESVEHQLQSFTHSQEKPSHSMFLLPGLKEVEVEMDGSLMRKEIMLIEGQRSVSRF
ncbi:MAG: hypothetical protein AAGG55_06985 [Pseudomonadota bacterium]